MEVYPIGLINKQAPALTQQAGNMIDSATCGRCADPCYPHEYVTSLLI